MNIILVFGFLLILLSFISRKKLPPYWGFLIVFLIMGFQEGVEGDFMNYKTTYENYSHNIGNTSITATIDVVWLLLIKSFSTVVPFWFFVIVLSAFECWILYLLCKKYGEKEYGWIAPILFFFTFYMMLIQMKALRQGLAVELIVLAYMLIDKKKGILWGCLVMLIALYVHHSAIISFPIIIMHIILSKRKDKKNVSFRQTGIRARLFPFIMVAIYYIVYFLKSTSLLDWLDQLAILGSSNEIQLSDYFLTEQKYVTDISWLIVLYNAIIVFLSSWFIQQTTMRYKLLAIVTIAGCYGDMLFFGMGSLPRIMMFYYVFNLITFPNMTFLVHKRFGAIPAYVLVTFLLGYAVKSSLPMILSSDSVMSYATYRFVFLL